MENVLIVGGGSGIGKSIAIQLIKRGVNKITIVDKNPVDSSDLPDQLRRLFDDSVVEIALNLNTDELDLFDDLNNNIDTLIITAGFGRLALFENLVDKEICNLITCNALAPIRIIKKFYNKICSNEQFNCAVMASISGHITSPYYSVYGASKAALSMFIENVNNELSANGVENRILDCSPGFVDGTSFNNNKDDFRMTQQLAGEIIDNMLSRQTLYIPKYDEIYRKVINEYRSNPKEFGMRSYLYKKESGRVSNKPHCVIGYLSGTFDLFHIGHLNLLKNAKKYCDYLVVGVHKSGEWKGKETYIPLEERKEIVGSCKYVDKVVDSCAEDSDAWLLWRYDMLFVGSDYKGSERFASYENYFSNKPVQIVYLPYTKSTSSTQLRKAITS